MATRLHSLRPEVEGARGVVVDDALRGEVLRRVDALALLALVALAPVGGVTLLGLLLG